MISFISPCLNNSFFRKSGKNCRKFFEPKMKFLNLLKMEKDNLNYSKKIQKYKQFLPQSFFIDNTAPFAFSFMWLQRIGRLDLNENLFFDKNNYENRSLFQISFRSDPTFRISKKTKKKKKEKIFSSISVGKNKEEKMILFDYNKKKSKNNFLNLNSYSKKFLEKKRDLKLANFYSIISIQNNKVNRFIKLVIILILGIFSFLVFNF
ncbi:hypothetical protein HAN_2g216 (nucleomorph) [Hemiselmis andersenii]|uniref:Uncharacterized protein n=1 Tax=Hemiselmis andersenii TaxID=464988 RepID=A9BKN8_HEMAN|nr:hypothetical protein HAN_2g216 [Hemiselmis andersenii]ABW98043.1 hypothetical protein HAN_2g216 [Hemiselmis andersenii]|mmetsp:Transcript_27310/g.66531  ORF Transcript_27310/g.66531 Transcript_27310/m.66531 type:complete len:207 (+) Transcript_27310:1531-2151(+)